MIAAALLGVFTWTLLEYVLHRWAGHAKRLRGNPFGLEHVRHHAEGDYFAPTWKKALIALGLTPLLGAPAYAIAGGAGLAWLAGLLGAYAAYEILHRREHTHAGALAYGRWARRHHFHHHFVDARKNHGVTSPLWDFVFGTYARPTVIKVPRKLCMTWLRDPRARAAYGGTFVVQE